jgi:branched-chain amino acid transport system substrate-binding protein
LARLQEQASTRAGVRFPGPSLARLFLAAATFAYTFPATADLLVGVAAPARGAPSASLEEIRAGVERAVARINAAGGVAGEKLVVEAVDDGCSVTRASAAAAALIARKASLVVGHPCSTAAIAAARLYAKAPLIFVALGARHPELTDKRAGPNVYRLAGRDARQGETAAAHIAATLGGRPIAIVQDRTLLARTISADVLAGLAARGIAGVPVHGIVAGHKDYGWVVEKLKQARIEAVFFAGFPAEAVVLLRQFAAAGLAGPFYGPDTLATGELADAGVANLDKLVLTAPDNDRPLARDAEAAVEAWAVAAAITGPPALGGPYATAIGPVAFDAKGDANVSSFRLLRWSGSRWEPLPRP